MWFFYLLSLIGASAGIGVFVAYEAEQEMRTVLIENRPEAHAEASAQITRALRRLHRIDPSLFPSPQGTSVETISSATLSRVLGDSRSIPPDVIFEIDSTGEISSRLSGAEGVNPERFLNELDQTGTSRDNSSFSPVDRSQNDVISNPQYSFDQEPNFENVFLGQSPERNGGGIQNSDPNNTIYTSWLIDRTGVQTAYDIESTPTEGLFTPPTSDTGTSSGGTQISGGSVEDDEFDTTLDTRHAYTQNNDYRYGVEREFNYYCDTLGSHSEAEISQQLDIYVGERKFDIEQYRRNNFVSSGTSPDVMAMEEASAIQEGFVAAIGYCGSVYYARNELSPTQVQANSAPADQRQELSEETDPIISARIPDYYQSSRPGTPAFIYAHQIVDLIVGVKYAVQNYPQSPQNIDWPEQ